MATDAVEFYLRNRRQISAWAELGTRADDLMRDAVKQGAVDKALNLLKGESGEDDVDFYVRNRSLITQWDSLQTDAGAALHAALLSAGPAAGCDAWEGKAGWSEALVRSPEFDKLKDEQSVWVQLAWTKQHLLSTRRGYPFPRLALVISPNKWKGESRDHLIKVTRPVAHELGMKKKDNWWAHWRMFDEIPGSPDLRSYADDCVTKLQEASQLLYPVLATETSTAPVQP